MNKKMTVIWIGALLLGGFGLAAIAYSSNADKKMVQAIHEEPDVLIRESAKVMGPASAKVHIVEFMDPGCETCRAFHPYVQQLLQQYPGKVKVSIRYLPLHQGADTMVKILEAADMQGKYWDTLHLMFESQPQWASHHNPEPDKIWPLLPQVGLDVDAIRRDMEAPAIAAILEQDLAAAGKLGIRKTPSFFVNGEPLRQFGYQQLAELVARAVDASY